MKRDIVPIFLLLLGLGLFGGFAWLTRYPESPWLEKAQEWPVVGESARRFREAYLGPQALQAPAATSESSDLPSAPPSGGRTTPSPRDSAAVSVKKPQQTPRSVPTAVGSTEHRPQLPLGTQIPKTSPQVDAPAAPSIPLPSVSYIALEWVWFLPGNEIFDAANSQAAVRTHLEAMAYLPILRKEGTWVEVMYQDRKGWIDTLWKPPHRRRGARRGLLRHRNEPVHSSSSSLLRSAKKILGIRKSNAKLGAYTLFTDVQDQDLLTFLDLAARAAEEAYFARYSRLPSGDPYRAVVLFAQEADYRRYSQVTSASPSGTRAGHAGGGMLAFYAEGRSRVDLARTLVHEITHLLNDRSLAWHLPPWLEEGMATDLGSVWVENSLDVTNDPKVGAEYSLRIEGFEARILLLERLRSEGKLPSVAALLNLDRETFLKPQLRSYAYAHSAAFIRYLGEGEGGRFAPGFHKFLQNIANRREADLLKLLGIGIDELDQGFRHWLQAEVRQDREELSQRAVKFAKQARP